MKLTTKIIMSPKLKNMIINLPCRALNLSHKGWLILTA